MKALILGGGGARGAYEAGVAISLLKHEQFDIICGTSIGALNGALIAQGDIAQLERLWRSIASYHVISLTPELQSVAQGVGDIQNLAAESFQQRITALVRLYQVYAHLRSARHFTRLLGALDSRPVARLLRPQLKFGWLARTLIVSVTNLTRCRPEAFYHFAGLNAAEDAARFQQHEPYSHRLTEANYFSAVCASAAVPGAFPPLKMPDDACENCEYVDGGIANDAPITQAIDAGASEVTVVFVDLPDSKRLNHPMTSIAEIGLASNDIMHQKMVEHDLKLARMINNLVLLGQAPGKRYVEIRTITPQIPLGLSVLDFDKQERIDAALEHGKRDGEAAIEKWKSGASAGRVTEAKQAGL